MRSECKEVKLEKSAKKVPKVPKSCWWKGFTNIWVGNGSECLYALCMVLLGDTCIGCGVGVGMGVVTFLHLHLRAPRHTLCPMVPTNYT